MIEWHVDFTAPWWIIPPYIGCLGLLLVGLYVAFALIDRWWRR